MPDREKVEAIGADSLKQILGLGDPCVVSHEKDVCLLAGSA